jgi:hypothetical protein
LKSFNGFSSEPVKYLFLIEVKMVEYTYDPGRDQKDDLGLPNISKIASFKVQLPYRENILWPQKCVMCEAPAKKNGSLSDNYRSGNYLVAKRTSTMTIKGVPYCNKCHRRYNLSPIQGAAILLGLLIGIGVFAASGFIDGFPICMGCGVGAMIFILFSLIGIIFLGGGMGSPPVTLDVKTEEKVVGNKRPVQLDFSFRNRRYSEEFRDLNMPKQERYDLW